MSPAHSSFSCLLFEVSVHYEAGAGRSTIFATTNVLSRQTRFYRDKYVFVATKDVSVSTKICLSRQNICRDKNMFIATNIFFFATKRNTFFSLSLFSRQTHACRDKTFVVTKIVLVAAPASDNFYTEFTLLRPRKMRL